ncbi:MAG TPA: ATP-grasp fold amidoligase family protein [Methylovirgula sp.]
MTPFKRFAEWRSRIKRLRRHYINIMGRRPAFFRPRLYTEKMQWRKLFGYEPFHAICCDKMATRDYISAKGFGPHLTELIWAGEDLDASPLRSLTVPYVLKSSHASGHFILINDPKLADYDAMTRQARQWLQIDYGEESCEPGYLYRPRRLMIERMILFDDGTSPTEHRIFVFRGKAHVIISEIPFGDVEYNQFHTADWRKLHWKGVDPLYKPDLPRPPQLDAMIAAAEQLAGESDHLRVDFYEDGSDFRIGELTPYSHSGLIRFEPDTVDAELGALWTIPRPFRRALNRIASSTWAEQVAPQ